jgi:hypothetical protein
MRTQILKGPAAMESLLARGLADWQAKQVLSVARTYGYNGVPIDGGYSVMTVSFEDGHFVLGDFRLPKARS